MSLEASAAAPQQSAPAAPPVETPVKSGLLSGGQDQAAPPSNPAPASNGADWRALIAGDDTKAITDLARYKSPNDFYKAHSELRSKLSQRPTIPTLAPDAAPEQIAEYRKAAGVPDVAPDAGPEAYMNAYGIKPPQGYEVSEYESGALQEFAKHAHASHLPPTAVKAATDYFFKAQAAAAQQMNKANAERAREWTSGLQQELGKDFQPMVASAEAYLDTMFDGDPDGRESLLNAQLPGGGMMKDHPGFIRMLIDGAMKSGMTDRIESASMESNGASLGAQQAEIEALLTKDSAKYNDPRTQDRLKKIIELRMKRGELDENGNEARRRRS